MKKLLWILLLIPCLCFSANWKMLPEKSKLTFTATQNNAPVEGSFKIFTTDINFDPEQLNTSHVNVSVDIHSLSASYQELVSTLLGPDWFNAKQYPKATFKSTSFSKLKDKEYQAQGNLTIRDKTFPVTVAFTLKEYSNSNAVFTGNFSIKRLSFGVGQGEWSKPDQVKDDVRVNFVISAARSN